MKSNNSMMPSDEKMRPDRIKSSGMTKIRGEITRSQLLVDEQDIAGMTECLISEVKEKYKGPVGDQIIKYIKNIHKKKQFIYDKNWLIFESDNGSIGYYGFLEKKIANQFLICIYEFSIQFAISKDMYIKRFQSYSEEKQFLGGTNRVYVSIDSIETKSRGLLKEDLELLSSYSNMLDNQFKQIDLKSLNK